MWASLPLSLCPLFVFLSPFCSFFKALKVVYAKRWPLSKKTKPGRQTPKGAFVWMGWAQRKEQNKQLGEPRRLQNVESLSYALPGTGRMSVCLSVCLLFCSRCRFVQFQCPAIHSGGVFEFSYKSQQEHILYIYSPR